MTFESEDNVNEETSPEPAEELSPKERRKRSRSTHGGETTAQRSVEERKQERAERRAAKARQRRTRRVRERERRAARPKGTTPEPVQRAQGATKVRQGVVVSDKPDKTITVRIDTARRHRMYKKIVRSSTKLHVHDERNDANEGDIVRVIQSRPLSRTKRWRLVEVLERAR